MRTVVVVSGGFDPLHSGHIAYFREARKLGEMLIAGINSDEWLTRKKGKPFLPLNERIQIVGAIRYVDYTLTFDDSDDSASLLLKQVKQSFPDRKIIVANGGDRNASNNREIGVEGVEFVYGVGGSFKMNASSTILRKWNESSSSNPNNQL